MSDIVLSYYVVEIIRIEEYDLFQDFSPSEHDPVIIIYMTWYRYLSVVVNTIILLLKQRDETKMIKGY